MRTTESCRNFLTIQQGSGEGDHPAENPLQLPAMPDPYECAKKNDGNFVLRQYDRSPPSSDSPGTSFVFGVLRPNRDISVFRKIKV
jgi:hypothetical protein